MYIRNRKERKVTSKDIKELMEKCDVDLEDIAEISGFAVVTVRSWLNGSKCCRRTVYEYIQLQLGVHPDYKLVKK